MPDEEFFEILESAKDDGLRDKYRLVFLADAGMEVLADILVNLCYYGTRLPPDNEAAIARYNVGIDILEKIGVRETDPRAVVNAILSVPIKEP
jgi:hypothetical protein